MLHATGAVIGVGYLRSVDFGPSTFVWIIQTLVASLPNPLHVENDTVRNTRAYLTHSRPHQLNRLRAWWPSLAVSDHAAVNVMELSEIESVHSQSSVLGT